MLLAVISHHPVKRDRAIHRDDFYIVRVGRESFVGHDTFANLLRDGEVFGGVTLAVCGAGFVSGVRANGICFAVVGRRRLRLAQAAAHCERQCGGEKECLFAHLILGVSVE